MAFKYIILKPEQTILRGDWGWWHQPDAPEDQLPVDPLEDMWLVEKEEPSLLGKTVRQAIADDASGSVLRIMRLIEVPGRYSTPKDEHAAMLKFFGTPAGKWRGFRK